MVNKTRSALEWGDISYDILQMIATKIVPDQTALKRLKEHA